MKNIFLFSVGIFLFTENIFPQSQGPNNPATANFAANGCLSCPGSEWNNYNNILVADGQDADVGLPAYPMCFQNICYYSRALLAENFNFSVPFSATITGVMAEVICRTSGGTVNDTVVRLLSSGQQVGNNNVPGSSPWSAATTLITYGSSSDLWGYTLTPDSVNQPGFGLSIMVTNSSSSVGNAFVDHVRMTIFYSLSTGVFSQTRILNNSPFWFSETENVLLFNDAVRQSFFSLSVVDVIGREICSFVSPSPGQEKYFLPYLTQGIYFAVLHSANKSAALKFAVR
ncbi:MAG: hypothetical protein JJE25_15545 [Bacteroidia bacterium]|nr:hypothetical protein [Bacteroidia bacterium]